MNLNNNYIKKTIYLKEVAAVSVDQAYYINIFLTKTCEIFEYVDVKKDEKIYKVDKQEINPFYIDFGFFNSATRIKVNKKNDLTNKMAEYLNANYAVSIAKYAGDVRAWFREIGYNMLINDIIVTIDGVTGKKSEENGLERLEKLEKVPGSIVSKSFYFPISINK